MAIIFVWTPRTSHLQFASRHSIHPSNWFGLLGFEPVLMDLGIFNERYRVHLPLGKWRRRFRQFSLMVSMSCVLMVLSSRPAHKCLHTLQYVHTLEVSLQEEIASHAPLYGVVFENFSMKELETLSRIHEEGLIQVHVLQQRKGSGNSLLTSHSLPHPHGLYPPPSPSVAIGLPPSIIPNGGVHSNGHMNGVVGQWFNPTT